jgi:uncharacterized protein
MTGAPRLPASHPVARRLIAAIKGGDLEDLQTLLAEDATLARGVVEDPDGGGRSTLHLLADAPGRRPRAPETLTLLVAAGADLNAAAEGMWHRETPLHWAASNDDVVLIDALLDAGAEIEAPGSSIGGGPPIQSAVGYGMDRAVARLHERGAQVALTHYVILGRVAETRRAARTASQDELDGALWNASARGDTVIARILIDHGARLDWSAPWNGQTSLDVARAEQQHHLLELLFPSNAESNRERD